MFLQFRAVKREGFNGVWCAGRLWVSSEVTRVQIVDEEPPKILQDLVENGRVVGQREIHDMTKIGKKSLEEIKADGRISIFPDGQVDVDISPAELQAAKDAADAAEAQVADLTAKLATATKDRDDAQFQVAEIEEKLKDAAARVAEVEAGNASLKEQASKLADELASLKATAKKAAKAESKADKPDDKASVGDAPSKG
jgi:hypothetical protein